MLFYMINPQFRNQSRTTRRIKVLGVVKHIYWYVSIISHWFMAVLICSSHSFLYYSQVARAGSVVKSHAVTNKHTETCYIERTAYVSALRPSRSSTHLRTRVPHWSPLERLYTQRPTQYDISYSRHLCRVARTCFSSRCPRWVTWSLKRRPSHRSYQYIKVLSILL